ncbi:hypothetical protein [Fictibacillus fluitans]|uniref:Uncharacterized protein n=1 Tax=Fictibacillus fluitans TaxID=3058422 RepID=A0ABT8HT72_9BACL|nr:hypothetical protein [Fictibacillus sp. NE201]MDN4523958.1 hypothetical protein [Fictibacillus sp. NE201]
MSFELISLIATIISALLGLWIYHKQKTKKELHYEIISATSLLSGSQFGDFGDLKVYFKNEEIKEDIILVILKMKNTGNVSILAADWEKPIRINDILAADIVEKMPNHLEVNISRSINEKFIEVEPMLLNKGDYFVIKLLTKSFKKNEFVINNRIAGIIDIKEIKEKFRPHWIIPILLSSLGISLALYKSLVTKEYNIQIAVFVSIVWIFFSFIVSVFSEWIEFLLRNRKK